MEYKKEFIGIIFDEENEPMNCESYKTYKKCLEDTKNKMERLDGNANYKITQVIINNK